MVQNPISALVLSPFISLTFFKYYFCIKLQMCGWGHGKHHINLTITQPIETFRTHKSTNLACWGVKPLLHV